VRTKDSCWSVGTISDPRELSGVSTLVQGLDGVLQVVSEPTFVVSWVCVGKGVRVYGAWRMWAQSGHMAWHMTTLDIQTWPRREVPRLGLTDEDVGLLRGVYCDILAPEIVISWPKA
jgi:hypothetical protein